MINQDWIHKACVEISHQIVNNPDLSGAGVEAIFRKHSPRCDSCAWWTGPQRSADGRWACTEPTISPEQMDEFMTLPDFGCVRWKEKR